MPGRETLDSQIAWDGCLTGDCPHATQAECDKCLADQVREWWKALTPNQAIALTVADPASVRCSNCGYYCTPPICTKCGTPTPAAARETVDVEALVVAVRKWVAYEVGAMNDSERGVYDAAEHAIRAYFASPPPTEPPQEPKP